MSYTQQCNVCGGWLDGLRSDMACDCPTEEMKIRRIVREELDRAALSATPQETGND